MIGLFHGAWSLSTECGVGLDVIFWTRKNPDLELARRRLLRLLFYRYIQLVMQIAAQKQEATSQQPQSDHNHEDV